MLCAPLPVRLAARFAPVLVLYVSLSGPPLTRWPVHPPTPSLPPSLPSPSPSPSPSPPRSLGGVQALCRQADPRKGLGPRHQLPARAPEAPERTATAASFWTNSRFVPPCVLVTSHFVPPCVLVTSFPSASRAVAPDSSGADCCLQSDVARVSWGRTTTSRCSSAGLATPPSPLAWTTTSATTARSSRWVRARFLALVWHCRLRGGIFMGSMPYGNIAPSCQLPILLPVSPPPFPPSFPFLPSLHCCGLWVDGMPQTTCQPH